ncbi:MAG: hypothetical protein MUF01_12010 [Bryobacterales bacterium]|jgi:ABC-2 type transport system permease protein|nr:hypothetical protein [Bryobacterales bacterium]
MAVYNRSYQRYEGPLTKANTRFLALARYTWEEMRASRLLTPVLYVGFLWPLVCILGIYLNHNLDALRALQVNMSELFAIDTNFFYVFLSVQSTISFFVAALAGPGRISPDLSNRGLSTLLARPISRTDYVLGRMLPLVALLSCITWVPGLLLVAQQTSLAGTEWLGVNWRIPLALVVGGLLWVGLLSLLAMALSAWVRWKPVAGGAMFMIFFVGAGFGALLNQLLEMRWGHLLNVRTLMATVWAWLMEGQATGGAGFGLFYVFEQQEIPVWSAFLALAVMVAACVRLLAKRIQGAEVVR